MAKKCKSPKKINGSPCKYPTARVYKILEASGNISKKDFDCVARQIQKVEKKAVADVAKADAKIEAIAEKAVEKVSSAYAEPNKPGASNVLGLAAMGYRIKKRSGRKSKKHSKRHSKKRSGKKSKKSKKSKKRSSKRKGSRKNKRRSH
jgi:hypothetical protein